MRVAYLKKCKRVVVKIGTGVLTTSAGKLDERQVEQLVGQMAALCKKGMELVVVTSGAIGAGVGELGLPRRPASLDELQACAAIGQNRLMHVYHDRFRERGYGTAQILVTADDFKEKRRHENMRHTFLRLLSYGVIPIVNENDTVAVEEIKFGDNDHLSALVTELVHADLLVILSVTDGLLTVDPAQKRGGRRIAEVARVTHEVERLAGEGKSELGSGGMKSKLEAAKLVTGNGKAAVFADGWQQKVLIELFKGKDVGTFFAPGKGD